MADLGMIGRGMRWHDLTLEQAKPLEYKIERAVEAIETAFVVAERPALAFSGGKDSTVLLHLIREHFPYQSLEMPIIYGNTGMEFAECIQFVRRLAREWRLDLHEARPGKTERPGFKYAAQRRIWEELIENGEIKEVLKPDGRLKSTRHLEAACPHGLFGQMAGEREWTWPTGTTKSYWWCADQYGWPLLGKAWSRLEARRINVDTFLRFSQSKSEDAELLAYYEVLRQVKISQHCCEVLKKEPAHRMQKALEVDLIFKGLMAAESRARAKNFLSRGYVFEGAKQDYLSGWAFFHAQPMAIWTDEDVWEYIRRYQVPYAPLYDIEYIRQDGSTGKIRRNGCIGCATDFGFRNNHLYILRQTHRRAWEVIMRAGMAREIRNLQRAMRANQLTLWDAFTPEELLQAQPCVFDDVDGLGGREGGPELVYDAEVAE